MGSKSKSASTNNDVTQNLADNRVVEGDGAIIGGNITLSNTGEGDGQFSIQQTDFGAVEGALALGERAIESVTGISAGVQEFGNTVLQRQSVAQDNGLAAIQELASDIATNGEARTTQLIQKAVIAAAVMGGVVMVVKAVRK